MGPWLAQNWWWLLPVAALPAVIALKVWLRGGDEPLRQRALYAVFPLFDAKSRVRQQLTPRAIVLWLIGILIVIVAFGVEKVFRLVNN